MKHAERRGLHRTLRLEEGQIAAAKQTAERMSIPYQTLLRMWIAERLAKERAG